MISSKRRAGAEVDKQWPRILKKMGSIGGGAASAVPSGVVPWANVSKAGSSLAHIADRDHGLLTGLGDDDHLQYVHTSSARTIAAQHVFAALQTFASIKLNSYKSNWSNANWQVSVELPSQAYSIMWPRGGLSHSWNIGATSGLFYFGCSTADDNSQPAIYPLILTSSQALFNAAAEVRSTSFTSGFTGNGWRIDNGVLTPGKTTGELDDLIVRGRMRVYELLVQQIRATNGSIFVSSTGKVKTVTGSGPYSIETDATHGFLVNDLIRAQRFTGNGIYQSNLQVTAVADTTHFTATLSSGDAPAAGMEFVRLGNTSDSTRQNSIYMSADDTYNPFIDIVTGVNSFAAWGSTASRKGRIGNLQGLFSVAGEHGIFFGNGQAATSQYLRLSSYTNELHNLPIKMYNGSGTLFLTLDTSGLYFVGQNQTYAKIRWSEPGGAPDYDIGAYTGGDSYNRMDLRSWSATKSATRIGAWNSGQTGSPVAYVEIRQDTFASEAYIIADEVGVGTTSPSYKLHVVGSTAALAVDGAARFGQGGLWGAVDGPSAGWIGFGANFYYSGSQAKYRATNYASMMFCSSDISFHTAGSGSVDGNITWAQKMVISNAGNVGIGATSPGRKLEVAGTIKAAGSDASWTTSTWQRAIELGGQGYALMWPKGASGPARGIGVSSNGVLYFIRSTADDASAGATYDVTISATGELATGDILVNGVARFLGGYAGLAEATEPATSAVYGYLFIDPADGDLKFKFKNGTVRLIASN